MNRAHVLRRSLGELLMITGGDFASVTFNLFGLSVELNGMLDCKALRFEGRTENGIWALGDPAIVPPSGRSWRSSKELSIPPREYFPVSGPSALQARIHSA